VPRAPYLCLCACSLACAHVACVCIRIGSRSRCSTSARQALVSALARKCLDGICARLGGGCSPHACLGSVCCTRCCTPMPSLAPVRIAPAIAGRCSLLCSDTAAAPLDGVRGPPMFIPRGNRRRASDFDRCARGGCDRKRSVAAVAETVRGSSSQRVPAVRSYKACVHRGRVSEGAC